MDRDAQRRDVLQRAKRALADARLDALVASSPENVCYTAGTSFLTQRLIPDRLALVALVADRDPIFVYCTVEEASARAESWLHDLRGYREHAERPMAVVAEALREAGLAHGRIGVEARHLVAGDHRELAAALPQAKLVDADTVFDRLRALKTPQEIDILARAAHATDAAIRAAFESSGPGTSEAEVADRLVGEGRARGGESVLHAIVATGANNFTVHAEPGATRIVRGGVLRTDFGMTWSRHYNSDVARTAFAAPLRPRDADAYRLLEEAQRKTLEAVAPAVRACDLYELCKRVFFGRGIDFWVPHVGHSIGIGLHERPMLHPYDETPLEAGMVLMVEPAITTDVGLLHTEDLVEVTETGARVHSRSADWTEPLVLA